MTAAFYFVFVFLNKGCQTRETLNIHANGRRNQLYLPRRLYFFCFCLFCLAGSPKTWILGIFLEGNRHNPLDFGGDSDYNLDLFSYVARKGGGLCPESVIFFLLSILVKIIFL